MNLTERAVTILTIAFCCAMAFQSFQVLRDRTNLQALLASQTQPLEQAEQIRRQTEALAGDTAALADKGNTGAKQAVDEMARQGLALHASPAPGSAPTP